MSLRGPSSAVGASPEGSAPDGGFFTEAMSRTPLAGPMRGETNLRRSLFREAKEKRDPEKIGYRGREPSERGSGCGLGRGGASPVAVPPVAHAARGLDPAFELVGDAAFQAAALAGELRGVRGLSLIHISEPTRPY